MVQRLKKINNDWKHHFIRGVFINQSRILKSITIILTRKGVVFDEVCMIATYGNFDSDDPERCAIDEVVLSMGFHGFPEEVAYVTYGEYLNLIECGLEEAMDRYEEAAKEEILQALAKARNELRSNGSVGQL
ncbi:hypothetical protein DES34_10880 [Brevibacillus brevis]|nr:hypothetical protein C7J99_19070 [Brevibacillus brevis]RED28218.1 hypothetical protein DES34_10880 [Brevibacillus brevis]GEC90504.1 hypothetical protein BBR01nite_28350 [Brevibacillus brevis]VEF90914.1 Uncharacterised protein [Brevibacillus brevis]